MAEAAKFLVRKSLCHSLICREVSCARTSLFSGDRKILPSRDPLAISFICDSGRHRDGRAKKIFVPKSLCHCLKGGKEFWCLDHVTGGHRPTGFLTPTPGSCDIARISRQPKPVRSGHSGPTLKLH